jgi:predicted nuclease of restriction endonuclease-like (RecB) superfamily
MPRKRINIRRVSRTVGLPSDYRALLENVKQRIRAAQVRATFSANAELIGLYWDIGRAIDQRQRHEGWAAAVIPRLARDIRNDLPEVKGFSERNISRMVAFFLAYPELGAILPQPVAKLKSAEISPQLVAKLKGAEISPQLVAKLKGTEKVPQPVAQRLAASQEVLLSIPWGHHILLLQKIKDLPTRLWYMQQTLAQGWSRNVLALMVDGGAHKRYGQAVTNFDQQLPPPQSDLARQALKDPYIFDFLTLDEPFHERELETRLLTHVEKFLLELGQGFAFVGRQFHLDVGQDDFYIDLLFYHLSLRCFIVIDLKKGPFKAEYAGKMNFYCNVVDDRLRHPDDQPTIGLILCQDKNRLVAEYALNGVKKAIGISEYRLTRALPAQLKSSLPSIRDIEAGLSVKAPPRPSRRTGPRKKARP